VRVKNITLMGFEKNVLDENYIIDLKNLKYLPVSDKIIKKG
jgi:hypothetical protein